VVECIVVLRDVGNGLRDMCSEGDMCARMWVMGSGICALRVICAQGCG
jgi:hypothetical protein